MSTTAPTLEELDARIAAHERRLQLERHYLLLSGLLLAGLAGVNLLLFGKDGVDPLLFVFLLLALIFLGYRYVEKTARILYPALILLTLPGWLATGWLAWQVASATWHGPVGEFQYRKRLFIDEKSKWADEQLMDEVLRPDFSEEVLEKAYARLAQKDKPIGISGQPYGKHITSILAESQWAKIQRLNDAEHDAEAAVAFGVILKAGATQMAHEQEGYRIQQEADLLNRSIHLLYTIQPSLLTGQRDEIARQMKTLKTDLEEARGAALQLGYQHFSERMYIVSDVYPLVDSGSSPAVMANELLGNVTDLPFWCVEMHQRRLAHWPYKDNLLRFQKGQLQRLANQTPRERLLADPYTEKRLPQIPAQMTRRSCGLETPDLHLLNTSRYPLIWIDKVQSHIQAYQLMQAWVDDPATLSAAQSSTDALTGEPYLIKDTSSLSQAGETTRTLFIAWGDKGSMIQNIDTEVEKLLQSHGLPTPTVPIPGVRNYEFAHEITVPK